MKKVLLVDLCSWQGHHEIYFMRILSILANAGYMVYACCAENDALRHNLVKQSIQNCHVIDLKLTKLDKLLLYFLKWGDKIVTWLKILPYIQFSSLFSLIATRRLIKQVGEKEWLVFFPHADSVIPAVPLFISQALIKYLWTGIYMQPSYQARIAIGLKGVQIRFYAERIFSLRSCQSVLVLHPIYQRFLSLRFPNLKSIYLPELIDLSVDNTEELSEKIIKQASGRKIISILGVFTKRRNLQLFFQSLLELNPDEYFALAVGQFEQAQYTPAEIIEIYKYINKFQSNAHIRLDYYIPNEGVLNRLIQISTVVFLNYQNHPFSSNLLVKCMALEKAVTVSPGFLMSRVVQAYNWGAVIHESPKEIASAVCAISTECIPNRQMYKQFMDDFSPAKFDHAIIESCITTVSTQ